MVSTSRPEPITGGDSSGGVPFKLGHRPALDGIRGLGMLSVVVFHTMTFLVDWYGPYGDSVLPGAFVAVDVFFVLSGFLITSLLLEERQRIGAISMRRFYIRRGLRLLPALYATIVLFGLVFMISGDATLSEYGSAVLKMFTYSANFFIGEDLFLTRWFGQTWSLSIEEQFYIVWPVVLFGLFALFKRRPEAMAWLLAVVILVVVGWRVVLWEDRQLWSLVYYRTDTRIDQPLAGALLAVLLHYGVITNRPRPWLGAIGFGAWMAATVWASPFEWSYYEVVAPALLVASCATILGVLHGRGPVAWLLATRPLRWFGRSSYTLYLVHVGIFELVRVHMPGEGRNIERVVVANAIALVATVVVHRLIEAPALRLKDRWAPAVARRSTAGEPQGAR